MTVHRTFGRDLQQQLPGWVQDGLVSADQAQALAARYPLPHHGQGGVRALALLAVLCLGAALFLVIGHNWDQWPRMPRMLALWTLTAALNGAGLWRWLAGARHQAVGWWLAGAISYGASIMLVAQIYHLGEHFPDGLLWWALGVLPVALLSRSRLLHGVQLLLATLWAGSEWNYSFPLCYGLFAAAALYQCVWCRRQPLLLLAAWSGLLWWLAALLLVATGSSSPRGDHVVLMMLCLMPLPAALYGMAAEHRLPFRRADSRLILALSTLVAAGVALVFSFVDAWQAAWYWENGRFTAQQGALALSLLVALALSPRMPAYVRWRVLGGGALVALLLWGGLTVASQQREQLLALVMNLLALAAGILLIREGVQRRQGLTFYGGVLLVLALALARYVELIGDYLTSALLFVVAAGVLAGAAWYWRRLPQEQQP
ncbi:DUF2157 domain-containing protein [Isoalcanivorax beigongshangi]|uniref:DUF2157 domain-containing protein n=1 Tax=Isoalcanivorax beigongshangi TaxID=3238810 RepID=A0ABV4AI51_9GAMM